MFDSLILVFEEYPYFGVAGVFLLCSIGLPLPEELVLIAAGYVCYLKLADWPLMMATSVATIMAGDLLPFFLGRTFGTRLLRLRPLRFFVTKRRLKQFDTWFRRRGDLVIFIARFVAGLRVVAYFTAGTMRMSYPRFVLLDMLGIALVVPTFTYVGLRFGGIIEEAIKQVEKVESGIKIAVLAAIALGVLWYWLRRNRENGKPAKRSETYVGPRLPSDSEIRQFDRPEASEEPNGDPAADAADETTPETPETPETPTQESTDSAPGETPEDTDDAGQSPQQNRGPTAD